MHHICEFLSPEDVALGVEAACKKEVLLQAARILAPRTGLSETVIFQALAEREKLGSTGFGHGTAAPHARLPEIGDTHAVFLRLVRPVGFEAADERPVDLICAIVGPQNATSDPFEALVSACRALRNPDASAKLRQASDAATFHAVLARAS